MTDPRKYHALSENAIECLSTMRTIVDARWFITVVRPIIPGFIQRDGNPCGSTRAEVAVETIVGKKKSCDVSFVLK
ncbi:MAG: hypothetical protein ACR2PG_17750 [Hyphomicrobiaceae bacterium]